MAILCPENSPNPSKKCRFFCTAVRDAFSHCHPCKQRSLSYSSAEDETPTSDFDDVEEEVMSMIRAGAMEARLRRKSTTSKHEDEEPEDFMSVQSHFSLCSSCAAADSEAFFSVKTNFSHCSSVKDMDLHESKWWAWEGFLDSSEIRRRAIIQEFCHCEGWPFGLCRKVLLLPPLPKSPSESWTWCKGTAKVVRMH
ncbi:hypothetical protein Cgig2_012990 [Carnegiea gigantea]|uniref:Uncharacterized protein n=1 Tax=Carnegiea gigantea TaxID=171969 RepID=A0A9Q1K8T7_9CARY|nr:hypothetical protein Cgig2_012990 [Carnegiea gigantea]